MIVSSVFVVLGLCAVAYGAWGPVCSTVVLTAPLSFNDSQAQQFATRAGCSGLYEIQISFHKPEDPSQLVPILGEYARQDPGGLKDVQWEIKSAGAVVAKGVSRDHLYSPLSNVTTPAVTVGSFRGRRGSNYLLSVRPQNIEPGWSSLDPRVVLKLEPATLAEELLTAWLVGLLITAASGTSMLFCAIAIRHERNLYDRHEPVSGI